MGVLTEVAGTVWTVRSSGWMQPEGETAPCSPYLTGWVDSVVIDGIRYDRKSCRFPDTEGILPDGVTLPGGSNRLMDAEKYLRRPEDYPDVRVVVVTN